MSQQSTRRWKFPLCFGLIAAIPLALGAVFDCDEVDLLEGRVSVELQNLSDSTIHMLGPGESFDISNRLDPFDANPATTNDIRFIFVDEENLAVTIRAGANGDVIVEETCELPGELNGAQFLTVSYSDAPPRLSCGLQ